MLIRLTDRALKKIQGASEGKPLCLAVRQQDAEAELNVYEIPLPAGIEHHDSKVVLIWINQTKLPFQCANDNTWLIVPDYRLKPRKVVFVRGDCDAALCIEQLVKLEGGYSDFSLKGEVRFITLPTVKAPL